MALTSAFDAVTATIIASDIANIENVTMLVMNFRTNRLGPLVSKFSHRMLLGSGAGLSFSAWVPLNFICCGNGGRSHVQGFK